MSNRMRRRITTAKREEIEKEQKLLDTTIVRPFEVLQGLPTSYSAPPGQYEEILKNPLTVKDSAALYNSLLLSRNTIVQHAPMFKLHWVRQTAYAKKLAEMDKDKQKEVLEDRENKRRFAKATSNSLEAHFRQPVLTPEINARDVMSKLCESSITLGPHTMDIRIYIAKDSRSDKSKRGEPLAPGPGDQTLCLNRAFDSVVPEDPTVTDDGKVSSDGKVSTDANVSTGANVSTCANVSTGVNMPSDEPQASTSSVNGSSSAASTSEPSQVSSTQAPSETSLRNMNSPPSPQPNSDAPNSAVVKDTTIEETHIATEKQSQTTQSTSQSQTSDESQAIKEQSIEQKATQVTSSSPPPSAEESTVTNSNTQNSLHLKDQDAMQVDTPELRSTELSNESKNLSLENATIGLKTSSETTKYQLPGDIEPMEIDENPSSVETKPTQAEDQDHLKKAVAEEELHDPNASREKEDARAEELLSTVETSENKELEVKDIEVDEEKSSGELPESSDTDQGEKLQENQKTPTTEEVSSEQKTQADNKETGNNISDMGSQDNKEIQENDEKLTQSQIQKQLPTIADSDKKSNADASEMIPDNEMVEKKEAVQVVEAKADHDMKEEEGDEEENEEEEEEEDVSEESDESEEEVRPRKYKMQEEDLDYRERGSGKFGSRKRSGSKGTKIKVEDLVEPTRRLSRLKQEAMKPPPPRSPSPEPLPPKPKGKRRGRPPLKPRPESEDPTPESKPVEVVKKRGRGRPRIHPIVEPKPPKKEDEEGVKKEGELDNDKEEVPKKKKEKMKKEAAEEDEKKKEEKDEEKKKKEKEEEEEKQKQMQKQMEEEENEKKEAKLAEEEKAKPAEPPAQPEPAPVAPPPPPPATFQSIESYIMIENLNTIALTDLSLNDLMRDVALGTASEAEVERFKMYIEQAKRMGPQPHHAEIYFQRGLPLPPNFPRVYPNRPVYDPQMAYRQKQINALKLTAFQERYLFNATLVIEFHENANVRYIIPQDSICEVIAPEKPPPDDAEEGTEFQDVLFSHIWIHNMDEVLRYESELQAYDQEMEKYNKEQEIKKKFAEENERRLAEGLPPLEEMISNEPRTLRTKKKASGSKKKDDAPQFPADPNLKYTTYSFTLHNIPTKYVPIVTNSVKPAPEIRARMEKVLRLGTRVASYYLWYRVDARLDEKVAESLRFKAVEEEEDMPGLVPPVEPKKRKPSQNKNPKQKRMKEGSPDGRPVVQGYPMTAKGYTPVLNTGVTGPEPSPRPSY